MTPRQTPKPYEGPGMRMGFKASNYPIAALETRNCPRPEFSSSSSPARHFSNHIDLSCLSRTAAGTKMRTFERLAHRADAVR
jgi:hypothetical protein